MHPLSHVFRNAWVALFAFGLSFLCGGRTAFAQLAPAQTTEPPHQSAVAAASNIEPVPVYRDELSDRAAKAIKDLAKEQGLVGLSVALADSRREPGPGGGAAEGVFLTAHHGFENRESDIPASDRTTYRWASVSKPLTAVLAMHLAAQGKLDLECDVRTLVPEFPDKGEKITPRLLLTHQSGIVHYSNGRVVRTEREYPPPHDQHPFESVINALDTFKDSPLVCKPGERHSYSTHAYILLSAAIERAGGKPFWPLMRERICKPLGLQTLQPDYQWVQIPNRAVGYKRVPVVGAVVSTNTDVSWKLAGGGFISTVADMAAFGAAMLDDRLLDRKTRAQMWKPQPTTDRKTTTYGLGWGVGRMAGYRIYTHSGSQEKTATYLLVMPRTPRDPAVLRPAKPDDQNSNTPSDAAPADPPPAAEPAKPEADESPGPGIVCAVMCNTEGAKLDGLARELAKLAIEFRQPAPPAPPAPEPARGK